MKEGAEDCDQLKSENSLVMVDKEIKNTLDTIIDYEFDEKKKPKMSYNTLRTSNLVQVKQAKAIQIVSVDHSQMKRNKIMNQMWVKRIQNSSAIPVRT